MKTEHTQGPWRIDSQTRFGDYTIAAGQNVKACVFIAKTQSEANAHLIAAAPDLLAQLQSIRVELEAQALGYTAMEIWPHVRAEMIRRILLTISKAEGSK